MNRERNNGERRLEDELRALGPRIEYPPTPDLARAARRRLEEDEAQPPRRSWFGAPFLSPRWAVAAVLVLVAIVPVFSPDVRDAVGDLFVTGQGAGSTAGGAGGDAAQGGERAAGEEDLSSPQAGSSGAEAQDMPVTTSGAQTAGGSAAAESGIKTVKSPNDRPVPDVVGTRLLEACEQLSSRDYVGHVIGVVDDGGVGPGRVISQKPRPGRGGFLRQPVQLIVSDPYPAEELSRERHCYDVTEYGPGGKPNIPNPVPD